MGKVIVESLVPIVLAGILALVLVYYRRRSSKEKALANNWAVKGDLNKAQEKEIISENQHAAALFRRMLAPPEDWGTDMTILNRADRQSAEEWISAHNKRRGNER